MKRVLLVEDDETARAALGSVLTKEGFTVTLAQDGEEGIALFLKEAPDIVITDLRMPKVDGMAVLRKVRQHSRETEVIVISGHGEYDVAIEALREGATDYVKKPIQLGDIFLALDRCGERIERNRKFVVKPVVLVVEDEQEARESLVGEMNKEGWTVLSAADGEQALNLFQDNRVDVILTDIRLPKKDGMAILEATVSRGDCEVILMSGYGDEAMAIQAMRLGAINFIRKPLELDLVLISVERAFEKVRLKRANLHRVRELELANEVISRISGGSVVLDFDALDKQAPPSLVNVKKMFDPLLVECLVVSSDLKVVYSNPQLIKKLGREPKSFGIEELCCLTGATLDAAEAEKVIAGVRQMATVGAVLEIVKTSAHSAMVLTAVAGTDLVAVLFKRQEESKS